MVGNDELMDTRRLLVCVVARDVVRVPLMYPPWLDVLTRRGVICSSTERLGTDIDCEGADRPPVFFLKFDPEACSSDVFFVGIIASQLVAHSLPQASASQRSSIALSLK